jgi:hypothetical protein
MNAEPKVFDADEVRRTFSTIIDPGAVFEIRAPHAQLRGERRKGPVFGYFNEIDKCLSELARIVRATGI